MISQTMLSDVFGSEYCAVFNRLIMSLTRIPYTPVLDGTPRLLADRPASLRDGRRNLKYLYRLEMQKQVSLQDTVCKLLV